MQIINLHPKIEELLSTCSETSIYIYVCVYTFLYVYLFHSKEIFFFSPSRKKKGNKSFVDKIIHLKNHKLTNQNHGLNSLHL